MQPTEEIHLATLCLIICKGSELALRIDNIKDYRNSKVTEAPPNSEDTSQLWLVDHSKDQYYQIVNALSDFCLDQQSNQFRLSKPKWAASQLISIQKSPVQEYYQYYWLRLGKGKNAASLQGVLRSKPLDYNDPSQLFRFEPIGNTNSLLKNTVMIENPLCGKVLDVPEASMEGGVKIIQWKRNGRFNQRWKFIKTGNAYQIRSFKSGLDIDINHQSKKAGASIIQWDPSGSSNQLWMIEPQPNNLFAIRSVHANNLFLGIQGNSKSDGAKVVTVAEVFCWRLDGLMFN